MSTENNKSLKTAPLWAGPELRRRYETGMSLMALVAEYGWTRSSITKRIRAAGGKIRPAYNKYTHIKQLQNRQAKRAEKGSKPQVTMDLPQGVRRLAAPPEIPADRLPTLREARLRKRLSLRQLAEVSGLDNSQLSKIERGLRPIPEDRVDRLHELLGEFSVVTAEQARANEQAEDRRREERRAQVRQRMIDAGEDPDREVRTPEAWEAEENLTALLREAAPLYREAQSSVALDRDQTHVVGVPTNEQLAESAKDKTFIEVFRGWLSRHSWDGESDMDEWLDWAAPNLDNDPEFQAVLGLRVAMAYQMGERNGRLLAERVRAEEAAATTAAIELTVEHRREMAHREEREQIVRFLRQRAQELRGPGRHNLYFLATAIEEGLHRKDWS